MRALKGCEDYRPAAEDLRAAAAGDYLGTGPRRVCYPRRGRGWGYFAPVSSSGDGEWEILEQAGGRTFG